MVPEDRSYSLVNRTQTRKALQKALEHINICGGNEWSPKILYGWHLSTQQNTQWEISQTPMHPASVNPTLSSDRPSKCAHPSQPTWAHITPSLCTVHTCPFGGLTSPAHRSVPCAPCYRAPLWDCPWWQFLESWAGWTPIQPAPSNCCHVAMWFQCCLIFLFQNRQKGPEI